MSAHIFDIDGTIVNWHTSEWLPGAIDTLVELIMFGYNHMTDSMNEYQDWNAVLEHLL